MSSVLEQFWSLSDEARRRGEHPDILTLLRAAAERGIVVDADLLRAWQERVRTPELFIPPDFIPGFIAAYLRDKSPLTILDPWAGTGTLLAQVVRYLGAAKGVGITLQATEHEVAKLLHPLDTLEWQLGDPSMALASTQPSFDVVVSSPPFGTMPSPIEVASDTGPVQLRDDRGNLLVLAAAQLLQPNGVGFFIVSPGFFFRPEIRRVYPNLVRFGLSVDAALALPHQTFSPVTAAPAMLIIITRNKQERLFVGELTPESAAAGTLLKNLKNRKPGK